MDYYNLPLNTSGAQLRQTLEADFGGRLRRHFGGRGPVPSVVRRGGPDRFGGPNKAILPRSGGGRFSLSARAVSPSHPRRALIAGQGEPGPLLIYGLLKL